MYYIYFLTILIFFDRFKINFSHCSPNKEKLLSKFLASGSGGRLKTYLPAECNPEQMKNPQLPNPLNSCQIGP